MKQKLILLTVLLTALSAFSAEYYVDASRPDDTGVSTNWDTAKKTIQAAVDLTIDGDTVWVTNGVYNQGGRPASGRSLHNLVLIDKAIAVRSINGAEYTFIVGNQNGMLKVRGVYMAAGSTLSGFTITNGFTLSTGNSSPGDDNNGGGIYAESTNCLIMNCVISGNATANGLPGNDFPSVSNGGCSGYGGGVYSGTLAYCTLVGNRTGAGGRGGNVGLFNTGNGSAGGDAGHGGGAYGGTLTHCLLINNTTGSGGVGGNSGYDGAGGSGGNGGSGGGVYNGTLTHCTLSENAIGVGGAVGTSAFLGIGSPIVLPGADGFGAGVYGGSLQNSIVWGNASNDIQNASAVYYSCAGNAPSENGNIRTTPQFIDSQNRNFRLAGNSPCINAGNNSYVSTTNDLDGNPRIVGGVVDMGAYESEYYVLTVNNGSGSGAYTNTQVVEISADAPITGKAFDRWIGDTQVVDNVTAASAIVTLSTNAVSLTATYTNLPGWYTLTVNHGSGSGVYTSGQQVAIAPDAPPTGKAFSRWIDDGPNWSDVANLTITMPAQDDFVTAIYTNLPGWYTLTINNGTGSGVYTNGQQVAVAADTPPTGKAFSRWIGATGDFSSTNIIVTMLARDISLTATYTNLPGWYTLTVTNGTGGGTYTNETQVLITASNAPTGQAFDRWIGDTQYVDSVTATSATVTMSTSAVSLTATYTNLPGWYTLTVINGTAGSGPHTNGAQVLVTASALTGRAFDRWAGDTQYVDSVTSANATVTMPAQDISLTATYTNLPGWYTLTVNNGTGGGVYPNGAWINIDADAPPTGKIFNQWVGATQYVATVPSSLPNYVARVPSSPAIVIMPATNISVTATYGYYLRIYRGFYSGFCTNGQKVSISFWPFGAILPSGWAFDRWTGDTQYVANVTSATTIVTMPSTSVVCIADFRDIQRPVLTVSSPITGERVGGAVKVTGKVTDNDGATDIFIRLNGGGWMTNSVLLDTTRWTTNNQLITRWATNNGFSGTTIWATNNTFTYGMAINIIGPTTNTGLFGTTSWTNSLTLPLLQMGTNVLQVYARDGTGNISTTNTLKFVYVKAGNLTIQTNGPGTVTRAPSGVPEVGLTYTLTAVPTIGTVFTGWTGDAVSNPANKVVTFPMGSNSTFTANFNDIQKPTVAITAPTASLRILGTNPVYTVKGTATDNGMMTGVFCRVNGGGWKAAATTNKWKNWSVPMTLTAGSNLVQAFSADSAGNISLTSKVFCTYVVTGSLRLQTNGTGTISRTPAGLPEVNKTYTLTATPGAGFAFVNWTGDAVSNPTSKVATITMTSNMTVTANFTDIQKPTVAITAPTALQRILGTNGLFTVRGTAADNKALTNVLVQLNGGSWTDAATTNNWKNWSLPMMLVEKTNTIRACSVDTTGNHSLTSKVVCTYVPTARLTIETNGQGSVTRAPIGEPEVGKTYTLTATPKIGSVFSNWTGDAVSNPTSKVATITMTSNKTVVANFTDIQKPTVFITYPTPSMRVMTNGTVVLRGTATDNGILNGVKYQLYTGEWTNAVSTNVWKNWTANFSPVSGLNTARVYSVDMQGNVSATSTVVFTYAPGAVIQVQTNGAGTVSPSYNGKVLEIGKSYTMTAYAKAGVSVFTNWTDGKGVVTNKAFITFVMRTNLVLTANFRSSSAMSSAVESAGDAPASPQTEITVDGLVEDWANVPSSSFSYASVTQEVAVALDGNSIALLLDGCPFNTSDNVLVYFKLRLSYGVGDNRHSVDLWTSGSVLYGMVDGQMIAGLEAVLLNGVLEVKLPVEQAPSQVTIEEIGCGMDLGGGALTEIFRTAR